MLNSDSNPVPKQKTFSPFDMVAEAPYQRWRTWKLTDYPTTATDLLVAVENPRRLSDPERKTILGCCKKANMAIYQMVQGDVSDKEVVQALGQQFGLERLDNNLRADEDSITSLKVMPGEGSGTHYIPYTNRPLNWHTDGYYNTLDEQVRGVVLHCVSDAAKGGDNAYLDHELAYLLMRDENPAYVEALMQPDTMTIPPNIEAGKELRPAQSGPVFSVEPRTGALHMRYTARTRSIQWKEDRDTRMAVGFLNELLGSDSALIFRHHLQPGQGIICNNVLHRREGFTDDPATGRQRLMYRARYFDRIRGTGINDVWKGEQ